jgi:hypothetical protein
MTLDEFIADRTQLLDDFRANYERQRKKKAMTMIRNPVEWKQLLLEFLEIYDGEPQAQEDEDRRAA